MQNDFSALPHVPFTVPIPGMTFEEYREYLSWRIEIQVLATIWKDWKQSASGGERENYESKIMEHLVSGTERTSANPSSK